MNIILASSSPYRKQLLERLGVPFCSIAVDLNESRKESESALLLVKRLALEKARAAASLIGTERSLIIGSDQAADLNGQILTKPGNAKRAMQQLHNCSGQTVTFYTGIALFNSATLAVQLDVIPFSVTFRPLSDQQIQSYIEREKPFDCAGSFKAEGLGIALFDNLQGSDPTSLIGLPLIRLVDMLSQEGVDILTMN